jgi:hypothetical protein
LQVGIPMLFVYLLYRYRVPTLARQKKRCHQLRRLLETVNYESHGQMDELATFLNAESSEELTYEQVPDSVLEKVLSYLDLSVATDTATDGASRTHLFPKVYEGNPFKGRLMLKERRWAWVGAQRATWTWRWQRVRR